MNWRATAEMIGVTSIVASLIFVGLQLKQSQDIAIAAQYDNRAESTKNLILASLEADYVIPELRHGLETGSSVGDINIVHWLWITMDNHYFQYQSGFLSEESWQAQLRSIKSVYANCSMRYVWDWRKNGIRKEFVDMVEALPDACADS